MTGEATHPRGEKAGALTHKATAGKAAGDAPAAPPGETRGTDPGPPPGPQAGDGPGIIRDETGAQRLIGYVLDVGMGDGTARCWLDLDHRHLNRHDRLHGGIAATLLDNVSGAVCSLSMDPTGRHPWLTLAMNVSYLAPGLPGRITATARISGGGRRTRFVEAELRHEDGTLIATSTGVFQPIRSAPGETA